MNLFESGPVKILFHYSNIESLKNILEDGFLETRDYEIGTHFLSSSKENWAVKRELATIRPSMASTQKMEDITMNAGRVRFIIQVHKLLDKQRGIKVRPIAEFPISAREGIKRGLRRYLSLGTSEAEKMANKIQRKLPSILFDRNDYKIEHKDLVEFLKKELKQYEDLPFYKNLSSAELEVPSLFRSSPEAAFLNTMKMYFQDSLAWSKEREGEERIVFNKNIPLDPYYLKIELLPGFKLLSNANKGFNIKLVNLMKKNGSLFVKNFTYKKILSSMTEKK